MAAPCPRLEAEDRTSASEKEQTMTAYLFEGVPDGEAP
jgi:hypothetical protein